MDVPFDRRHENLASERLALETCVLLLFFHEGLEVIDRFLHDSSALDDLGQKHLPCSEQIAHHAHGRHQWTFDDLQASGATDAGLFGIRLDELVDPMDQRVLEPIIDRLFSPFEILSRGLFGSGAFEGLGQGQHSLCGVRTAIEQHVLDMFEKLLGDVFVDGQLSGVDDPHIHPSLDRMVKKSRMHRFSDHFVATEREADVADPTRDLHPRALLLDQSTGVDEVDCVVVVLFDAGCHR